MLQHTQLFVKLRFQDSCCRRDCDRAFLERNAKQDPRTLLFICIALNAKRKHSKKFAWGACLLPKDFLPRSPGVLPLGWDNKWPRGIPPASLRARWVAARRGPQRGTGARCPARRVFGFHFSFPGLSHFLSPGHRVRGPAHLQGPVRSPRGPKGGEFLWVPGVPRVRSETGNCKSPRPSALPRRFPVTPAPGRAPRS